MSDLTAKQIIAVVRAKLDAGQMEQQPYEPFMAPAIQAQKAVNETAAKLASRA